MIKELKKYQGINVLFLFLENPSLEIHIKELSRKLKISPATAKKFCDLYYADGVFLLEQKSNSKFFKLNNSNSYVKELKRFYIISKIKDKWVGNLDENIRTVAVYGSSISGEYLEESDIDILIISRKKEVNSPSFLKFQKKIKKEVNVTKMTYIEWEKLKQKNDVFVQEVLNNYFLIKGGKL